MRLQVGGLTKKHLLKHLSKKGVQLNAFAQQLFDDDKVECSDDIQSLFLTIKTPFDFGLYFGATLGEMIEAASTQNLSPCPLVVAPYLRLQEIDLAKGEYLTVVSSPLSNDKAYPRGLYLRDLDDGFWLRGFRCSDDCIFPPSKKFVFVLRSRRSVECDISLSSRVRQPFSPNLEGKLADLSEVPKQTLCFYQKRIDKEEQSLLFFRTPRVRFKGTVDLKNGYEITNV